MNAEPRELRGPTIPLPATIQAKAFLDGATLFVDEESAKSSLLASWLADSRALGHEVDVHATALDEIIKRRSDFATAKDGAPERDMHVKDQALRLIKRAASMRASDIHIMRREEFTEIQFRVHGRLGVAQRITDAEGDRLIRAIYNGLASVRDRQFTPTEAQNAQISGDALSGTGLTSVRIVRGPMAPEDRGCNFMVMRLQAEEAHLSRTARTPHEPLELPRQPSGELALLQAGFEPKQVDMLLHALSAPEGAIIVTGPTGSGKTTTMYEGLKYLARAAAYKRQGTIEDPPEYPMPWAVQLSVTNAATSQESGDAYLQRLKMLLRMDPDILLIGEMRDAEVAIAMVNAALTGHLVLTTLHVTDPFQFVDRFRTMDNERLHPRVVCDPKIIRAVLGQRLLPLLCRHCSTPLQQYDLNALERRDANAIQQLQALATHGDMERVRLRGSGCAHCGGTGIAGRRAVAEVILTDDELMADIIHHGSTVARKTFRRRADADSTMIEKAIRLALDGLVDPIDVRASVEHIAAREPDAAQ